MWAGKVGVGPPFREAPASVRVPPRCLLLSRHLKSQWSIVQDLLGAQNACKDTVSWLSCGSADCGTVVMSPKSLEFSGSTLSAKALVPGSEVTLLCSEFGLSF